MAMQVRAKAPYTYAYAWHNTSQKAAKIPAGTILNVIAEAEGWYEIETLPHGTYDGYPIPASRWFVDQATVDRVTADAPTQPLPVYEPYEPTDAEVGRVVKWLINRIGV